MSNSSFGVLDFLSWDHAWNTHHYSKEDVLRSARLMQEAGVSIVRMDFLWSDLEPSKNHFDFDKYDAIVEILSTHNLHILGLLHYNPLWRGGEWNAAPDAAEFKRYAVEIVRHFKAHVHYWEIWNEPDHPVYWQPQDHLAAYSKLLQLVYPLIKQEDPGCQVLMGGLSQALPDRLEQLYKSTGRDSFDIVNIHPFVSPLGKDALKTLRAIYDGVRETMTRYHDETKPLWLTEIGCPGVPKTVQAANWWLGQNPTEIEQAEWLQTVYTEALKWKGIAKIFWAFFRDTPGHFKDGVDFFGLVRNDFSTKPSYETYKSLSQKGLSAHL